MVTGCTTGSGTLRTETRDVSGFTKVDLTGLGNVLIEQTGAESLSVQADDNLLPELTIEVSNGTLHLGTRNGKILAPTKEITYRVTVKDLDGLSLSGSGSETATKISANTLDIDISGSGNITVAGTADTQTVNISGSGNYSGRKLDTKNSTATISGSGGVALKVRDVLTTEISGSGNITYSGNPQVHQDNSGSGEVRKN